MFSLLLKQIFVKIAPKNLKSITQKWASPVLIFAFFCILCAYTLVFLESDVDFEQGVIFKMLYIHVPASWWALGIYSIMTLFAVLGFITRIPQFHIMASCWLLPGIMFTMLSLLTGMIWGKLTWGTFWVWDARLTSMFLHFLIYLSYALFITSNAKNKESSFSMASILLLIGFVNLPIIKWSVDWWFTLHQPASITFMGKNKIHQTYLLPLLLNSIGFFMWAFGLFLLTLKKRISYN
ncbi:MAG: cytochrome c biogenesis protein CcsA [Proteobacteria bacterium]|nr:cytochrome c biogenesis protein CcsA [Pseudomonadota bacterium]